MRLAVFLLVLSNVAHAQDELQSLEQAILEEDDDAEVDAGEILASSNDDEALPDLPEEPPRSDPDRVVLGFLLAEGLTALTFVTSLLGCLFDDGDDGDGMVDPGRSRSENARTCVIIAGVVGTLLGPTLGLAVIHDGDAFPARIIYGVLGAALGVGVSAAVSLTTDLHDGIDAALWATVPATLAVLGYEIGGRVRRRQQLQSSIVPRAGRRFAGLAWQLRY
ncbi:MAG: hypothetical protein AAGE52_28350 [Myxococcota bacterium]